MTAFLFLQRFEKGAPAPIPFHPLMDVLSRFGAPGRGRGEPEITLAPDAVAAGCTVVGDTASGALCVGLERPRFDANLRRLVWECMERFGCAAFDDTLDTAYVGLNGAQDLPSDLVAACANGVRQIGDAQQLWPDELETQLEGPPRPALRYPNPNANGPHLQLFDDADFDGKELYIELSILPQACNPGTLRVLRNLELRVDAAISANRDYVPVYRYADSESLLALLNAPRLVEPANKAVVASPPPGERRTGPGFVADRQIFASVIPQAEELARHVRDKYQIALDGSVASIGGLAECLDKAHAFFQLERARHSSPEPFKSRIAANWAIRAGCYLGGVIRRQIGGQWGYVTRGQQRLPVVRTHGGRVCHPHLQVLDHIVNGPRSNIADWFRALTQSDASPTPRDEDLACDIPTLCQILLGAGRFASGGLPLEDRLPRDSLDFSLASLGHLDRYLEEVARQAEDLSGEALSNLTLAAGAYVGETIRSNAAPGRWLWVNYDDFASLHPEFAQQRPRHLAFLAFLESAEETAYPLAQIHVRLAGGEVEPTRAFAGRLLGEEADDAVGPAVINGWPSDPEMGAAIASVREALDTWRRLATPSDYKNLRAADPGWPSRDSLCENFERQNWLLQKGEVVWASLIQANGDLFHPGPDDLPAALLYSPDAHFDSRPQALRRIAAELFAHKGDDAPEPLKEIGRWLANEVERAYRLPVPGILTDREVLISVFVVFRKHLPENVVMGGWFPILVHPDTRAVMIVPRHFWPDNLVAQWRGRELVG